MFVRTAFFCVLLFVQLCFALTADVLLLKQDDILGAAAEHTGGLILFQHDLITLGKDLEIILLADAQCSSQFDRKNDSSQLIHSSYNTCRLHNILPRFP